MNIPGVIFFLLFFFALALVPLMKCFLEMVCVDFLTFWEQEQCSLSSLKIFLGVVWCCKAVILRVFLNVGFWKWIPSFYLALVQQFCNYLEIDNAVLLWWALNCWGCGGNLVGGEIANEPVSIHIHVLLHNHRKLELNNSLVRDLGYCCPSKWW